jgi:hypothetical protein
MQTYLALVCTDLGKYRRFVVQAPSFWKATAAVDAVIGEKETLIKLEAAVVAHSPSELYVYEFGESQL